jgi:hypothetical protein
MSEQELLIAVYTEAQDKHGQNWSGDHLILLAYSRGISAGAAAERANLRECCQTQIDMNEDEDGSFRYMLKYLDSLPAQQPPDAPHAAPPAAPEPSRVEQVAEEIRNSAGCSKCETSDFVYLASVHKIVGLIESITTEHVHSPGSVAPVSPVTDTSAGRGAEVSDGLINRSDLRPVDQAPATGLSDERIAAMLRDADVSDGARHHVDATYLTSHLRELADEVRRLRESLEYTLAGSLSLQTQIEAAQGALRDAMGDCTDVAGERDAARAQIAEAVDLLRAIRDEPDCIALSVVDAFIAKHDGAKGGV